MKWSLHLGRIAGIKIYIHWTFLILLIWILFSQWQQGRSAEQAAMALVLILAVFTCVVLHELGHALMARWYHISTKDITLLPIGGLARLEKIPEIPKQELLVALAGPMVNVLLSILIGFYLFVSGESLIRELLDLDKMNFPGFMANLLMVNILLAVFNLIPAFPMDGGRIFRALLAFKFTRVQATRMAVALGQIIAIGFAMIGLIYNPFLLLIAIFVYLGAQFELSHVENKSLLHHFTVADIMMKKFHTLQVNNSVMDAVGLLLDSQEKDFVVVEGDKVVGILSSQEIIKALKYQRDQHPVSDVMLRIFRELSPSESLDEVFEEFQSKKLSVLPVVRQGKLIGILNMENVMEFIMVQNARESADVQRVPWLIKRNIEEVNTR